MRPSPGTVYLIGAGPGDPELITVRGLRILREADAILHDHLIPMELLSEARPDAEIIDVGKRAGFKRYEQEQIHELMIDRALRGLIVVRLKGGDPFVFGRGGEEVLACREAGVPVEVVPGVTSAFSVPAAAGIPVTHRGASRSCAIVTAASDPLLEGEGLPYASLVHIDTVVVLMGLSGLPSVISELTHAGRDEDTPVACVQAGWTRHQCVVTGTLETIVDRVREAGLHSPVTTVIGEVARFADRNPDALLPLLQFEKETPLSSS